MRSLLALLAVLVIAGCAAVAVREFDARVAPPDPTRFDAPAAPAAGGVSYRNDVQPILERRCVVCHGCYDAPCQLKLTAWEGVARGLSAQPVYQARRLVEAAPTRLFVDAQLPSQWRTRGFSPVLDERSPASGGDLAASLLYRTLALKAAHPLPATPVLSKAFDFALDRDATCPTIESFDAYAKEKPHAGMPYGLPGLEPREVATIARWLEAGAPHDGDVPLTDLQQEQVREWEAFLNGPSAAERLMSRYLYEHLFLGHLHFENDPTHRAFRLVRSATPSGEKAAPIATRRPYDDPGVARFFYRLEPERETILAKTHMPYALSASRMAKYRAWFLAPGTTVTTLPSYAPEIAANPFVAFRDLPIDGRYRFLLDEAEFFVMNFIKGPVCRGQVALDVIEDRFWVFFVDPRSELQASMNDLTLRESGDLRLPAEQGSNSPIVAPWLQYAQREQRYLRAKSEALDAAAGAGLKIDTSLVWDGGGVNANAALTVFRHFDSASVVKGLVGAEPKTAWIIDYPMLERIYYLLVAGYDVYGNAAHQLNSRLYMDFLRMEGEFNFLVLLPREAREPTAAYWYRGAPEMVTDYVYGRNARFERASDVAYAGGDPQRELYGLLRARVAPALAARFDLATLRDAALRRDLEALAALRGANLAWMPEASILEVESALGPPQHFSLLRDTAHRNVAHLFQEAQELIPAENALTVVPGFVGAYPNAIYRLRAAELPAFTAAVASLASEADYRRLADRFAVRRTNPGFWAVSDRLMDAYAASAPVEAGILDYGRLENR